MWNTNGRRCKMFKIKIIAKVRYNDGYAYVLNRNVNFLYTKMDHETIIGYDEEIYQFFKKDTFCQRWKAFGGLKFELNLTDGTTEKCFGQWWDGITKTAQELFKGKRMCHFSFSSKDNLKKCYVYSGCWCDSEWLEKLDAEYTGKIYDYYEYERMLIGEKLKEYYKV